MTFLRRHTVIVSFIAVVLLAFTIRAWGFGSNPPSINWDEASLGYNAYSILKTGHDEWGELLPFTFRAFGEYKLPGYIYATVPSIALLGLNEFSIRLPSILAGALTVGLFYLFLLRITGNKLVSLFGGVIFAFSPWAVFLSRIALEANVALFLVVLATYLFVERIFYGRIKRFIPSMILFSLAMFTYNSARLFVPPFVIALLVFYHKIIPFKNKAILTGLAILAVVTLFAIPLSFRDSSARYKAVALVDQGAIDRIDEQRNASGLPDAIVPLVYNRPMYFVTNGALNYLAYFSPVYLFFTGGSQYQFSLPGFGLLYLVELPLFLIGAFYLIKTKSRFVWLLLAWILLAPIPAAITRETPHVLRSILLFFPLELVAMTGVFALYQWLKKKLFQYLLLIVIFLACWAQAIPYFNSYTTIYPVQYSCAWQYGHKQLAQYLTGHKNEYDKILITKLYGEPHIFLLFYQQVDPASYLNDPALNRYQRDNWYWVDSFNGYTFVNDWELQAAVKQAVDDKAGKLLVVTSPGNYPKGLQPFETIRLQDGAPAFELLSIDTNDVQLNQSDIAPPPPQRGCF